jgi:hypothetical protein
MFVGTVPKTFGAVRSRRTAASLPRADQHFSKTADPEIVHDLSRVWPYNDVARQQRYVLIKCFAKAHGRSATILDPGIQVTFRRLKPGETPTFNR